MSRKCAAHGILTSFSCLTVILVLAQDGWATLGMLEGIERQASLFLAKDKRAAYRIPKVSGIQPLQFLAVRASGTNLQRALRSFACAALYETPQQQ